MFCFNKNFCFVFFLKELDKLVVKWLGLFGEEYVFVVCYMIDFFFKLVLFSWFGSYVFIDEDIFGN